MAQASKKPPVTVQVNVDAPDGPTAQASQAQQPDSNPSDPSSQGAQARKLAAKTRSLAAGWVEGMAPGHSNAVIFGVLGVLVALLIFWVGFFQALFVALMATAGVAFGQWLDGDPRIINAIKRLLAPSNDYR